MRDAISVSIFIFCIMYTRAVLCYMIAGYVEYFKYKDDCYLDQAIGLILGMTSMGTGIIAYIMLRMHLVI